MNSIVLLILEQVFIAVVIIFLIIVSLISMLRKKNFNAIYKLVYRLVSRFEKECGIASGDVKYTEVVQKVYEMLPPFLRLIFSHNDIDGMIETAVKQVNAEIGRSMTKEPIKLFFEDEEGGSDID